MSNSKNCARINLEFLRKNQNKSPQNYVTFTKHKNVSVLHITLSAEFSSCKNFEL